MLATYKDDAYPRQFRAALLENPRAGPLYSLRSVLCGSSRIAMGESEGIEI